MDPKNSAHFLAVTAVTLLYFTIVLQSATLHLTVILLQLCDPAVVCFPACSLLYSQASNWKYAHCLHEGQLTWDQKYICTPFLVILKIKCSSTLKHCMHITVLLSHFYYPLVICFQACSFLQSREVKKTRLSPKWD